MRNIRPIGHQSSRTYVLAKSGNRWKPGGYRQMIDEKLVGSRERAGTEVKRSGIATMSLKSRRDILGLSNLHCNGIKAERPGCCLDLSHLQHIGRIADVGEDRHPVKIGEHLAQKSEALACNIGGLNRQTGDVGTR